MKKSHYIISIVILVVLLIGVSIAYYNTKPHIQDIGNIEMKGITGKVYKLKGTDCFILQVDSSVWDISRVMTMCDRGLIGQ